MDEPKPTKKTIKQIAQEWDNITQTRVDHIEKKLDISFHYILLPGIQTFLDNCNLDMVLDVGCGIGYMTAELSKFANLIYGIDISSKSIQYAKQKFKGLKNVNFIQSSIEEFPSIFPKKFSLIVANMTLMTILSLEDAIQSISSLLIDNGHFVFTLTHPWFWPKYSNYEKQNWFEYSTETQIETPFKITLDRNSEWITTHVHRPLEQYVNSLSNFGLLITQVREPIPSSEISEKYGTPQEYPRFLIVKCEKFSKI